MIERDPEIIFAAEYFGTGGDRSILLEYLMHDVEIGPNVSGLWLQRNLLRSAQGSSVFENFARGMYSTPTQGYYDKKEAPVLIVDTHASGGVGDVEKDMTLILRNHRTPKIAFTLSPVVSIRAVERLQKTFEGQNIGFLLSGIYPEDLPEDTVGIVAESEEARIASLSRRANDLGLDGLVTLADFAQYTLPGQYLVAMGVTRDGQSYIGSDGASKRSTIVEKAMIGARNTDLLLGKALSYQLTMGNLMNPDEDTMLTVKSNILEIYSRALSADRMLQ